MALDLVDELASVTTALAQAGIEYAVCGGLALAVHGVKRFTEDLDLLVRPEDVGRALQVVKALGFDIPARQMVFGLRTATPRPMQRVSKLDPATGNLLPLDLLHVVPDYEPVWQSKVTFMYAGREIVVVSRDGLATMKKLAGRPKDLLDLASLEGRDDEEP